MKEFRRNFRVGGRRLKSCVTLVQGGSSSVLRMEGTIVVAMAGAYLLVKVDQVPARGL